ncbi:GDA1 [Symbiodinium pilosum]|uniref:GDA1 protein n=1 Tax=Symbiodinium pilosum TaxID=2952 RepID=A0A812WMZ2_SYMPI|nr:GDA1 [Symbiodinium pilosum]
MASVATGEEEGVFGWISANYLMGNLGPARNPSSNTTVGSLDLGGASAQIVFMPQKSIIQHAFPLKLGPHRLQVYSFSFLHFGVREAAHSTASRVISDALLAVQSETEVYHPCFAKGYIYTPKFSYNTARFHAIKVQMQGTSDFLQCEKLMKRIFNKDAPCLVAQCSFYGVYQPRLYTERFLAFAHFALIAKNLGLPETAQLEDFRAATQYVCSLTLEILDALFSRVEDNYSRTHLCFHATFAYVLLNFGYGMEEQNNLVFKTSHAGKPIDWAVGAMIYEINQDIRLSTALANVSAAS